MPNDDIGEHIKVMGGEDLATAPGLETREELEARMAEAAKEQSEKDGDSLEAKLMKRVWTFRFQPTISRMVGEDDEGNPVIQTVPNERFPEGVFKHKVPDVKTRRAIGLQRARLNAGLPPESLDVMTNDIHIALSHFMHCLDVSENPEDHWARNLDALDDHVPLIQLYEEVDTHVATFRGYLTSPTSSRVR